MFNVNFLQKSNIKAILSTGFVLVCILVLIGCSGGSSDVPTKPPETIYVPGEKNQIGITYGPGDGNLMTSPDDVDANRNKVPDRIEVDLANLYPGSDSTSTAKKEALMKVAARYTDILSLKNSEIPKTKQEAEALLYTEDERISQCMYEKAFAEDLAAEEISRRMGAAILYEDTKIARYSEFMNSIGVIRVSFYKCD